MVRHATQYRSRVAVLDDDIKFIRMIERVLASEDVETFPITTVDLEEAVHVIAESDSQVALVDIFMYGNAAGFDLIELMRRNPATRHMPIVVTSGARREIMKRVGFLQEHECEVLLKPFTPDEIVSQVRRLTMPSISPIRRGPRATTRAAAISA